TLFAEELGLVIECGWDHLAEVKERFAQANIPCLALGSTITKKAVTIQYNGQVVLDDSMVLLRQWWEETSHQLERLQVAPECADAEKFNIFDRQGPEYALSFEPKATAPAILRQQNKPKVIILRDEGSNSDREMSSAFYSAGFEPWDVTMTDLLAGRIDLARFRGIAAVGGFSYADVPESAKGWAATIRFNQRLQTQFHEFTNRPDTFTLGICNGCQLFGLLGWVPWQGIEAEQQPRFIHNLSGRFESRWSTVKILPSKAIMLSGMEGTVFGIHVDHGEGYLHFPDDAIRDRVWNERMAAVVFVDDHGKPTEAYPFNPNGSPGGLTGICSPDGRHLAMMPHPERAFLPWQCHWLPQSMHSLPVSPWLRMFQNAYDWCTG
ncbi:MAG: phosphoribosylformylglycinamidine synthase subunit PurQ, partial [Proteobacteria bacterium]|nr:phosphoribosylformylglycinamidine synthase subunit PurQ [Pseudomonadota bacterium]